MEDLCFVTFALFNVLWATVYIELWLRRSSELAYKWGTLDKKGELLQEPRPLYTVRFHLLHSFHMSKAFYHSSINIEFLSCCRFIAMNL